MNKNKPPQRLTTDELDAAMRMRGGEMFRPSEWEKARQYTGHGVNPMFRDIYSQAKVRNTVVGLGILGFVAGVYWYTIRSVTQGDFSEYEHEKKLPSKKK